MATATHLLTVREFSQLPEDDGACYHELRGGELTQVTRPKWKHFLIQRNIRRLLEVFAEAGSIVDTEVAFKPLPESELRVADVAWISASRLNDVDPEGYFHGVPELVVEVLSSSNTASDLYERESLCLENGCREFWIVDPARRNVRVSTPDGKTVTLTAGQEILLPLFNGGKLLVQDIFG